MLLLPLETLKAFARPQIIQLRNHDYNQEEALILGIARQQMLNSRPYRILHIMGAL